MSGEYSWDDHFGSGVRDKYRFAYLLNGDILQGQAAYDYLTTHPVTNDGQLLTEMFPTFPDPVPPLILNPNYEYGMGEKAKTIVNPEYAAYLDAYERAVLDYHVMMLGVLTLICKVQFPTVPYYENAQYYELVDVEWIPVEYDNNRYVGGSRWVTETNDYCPQYKGFLSYVQALGNDKDAILKRLLMI